MMIVLSSDPSVCISLALEAPEMRKGQGRQNMGLDRRCVSCLCHVTTYVYLHFPNQVSATGNEATIHFLFISSCSF